MKPDTDGIFIVGCYRSGTTLLRYLLDAHPELACPPESKFISGLYAFMQYPQVRKGLHSLGLTDEHIRLLLMHMAQDVFTFYARRHAKPRWVDKTPNYIRILPFIDELFGEKVRYLVLVRHPFDCALSMEEFFRDATSVHEDPEVQFVVRHYGKDLCGWARYWRDVNEQLHLFATTNAQRCHVLRYEDLVSDPDKRVSEILDFIGVERIPGDTSKMCTETFNQRHSQGYQDYKIQKTSCVHKDSINKWSSWTVQQRQSYWLIVGGIAEALGYRLE